jgi:hypothetical protein
VVPADWYLKRGIGKLRLPKAQRWLDLRVLEIREALRPQLAALLVELGMCDLDVSGVRGPSRVLTQAITRLAYEQDYQGVVYRSRFDDSLDCWAIFEGATFETVPPVELISRDDVDLRATADLFDLDIL